MLWFSREIRVCIRHYTRLRRCRAQSLRTQSIGLTTYRHARIIFVAQPMQMLGFVTPSSIQGFESEKISVQPCGHTVRFGTRLGDSKLETGIRLWADKRSVAYEVIPRSLYIFKQTVSRWAGDTLKPFFCVWRLLADWWQDSRSEVLMTVSCWLDHLHDGCLRAIHGTFEDRPFDSCAWRKIIHKL